MYCIKAFSLRWYEYYNGIAIIPGLIIIIITPCYHVTLLNVSYALYLYMFWTFRNNPVAFPTASYLPNSETVSSLPPTHCPVHWPAGCPHRFVRKIKPDYNCILYVMSLFIFTNPRFIITHTHVCILTNYYKSILQLYYSQDRKRTGGTVLLNLNNPRALDNNSIS